MRRENLLQFEGKRVILLLKNGFQYKGKLLSVNEDVIGFFDRKYGISVFTMDSISSVMLWGEDDKSK